MEQLNILDCRFAGPSTLTGIFYYFFNGLCRWLRVVLFSQGKIRLAVQWRRRHGLHLPEHLMSLHYFVH